MPAPLGNNNGHRINAWPLEHDNALQVLFAGGMSSSQIAATLNQRFLSHYTRNAVIGRRIRMGIKCVDPQRSSRRPREPTEPKPWDMAGLSKRHYKRKQAAARAREMPQVESPCLTMSEAAFVSRNIALVDLEPDHCRWPCGPAPVTFCGHPRADGSSYCPSHRHISGRGSARE